MQISNFKISKSQFKEYRVYTFVSNNAWKKNKKLL